MEPEEDYFDNEGFPDWSKMPGRQTGTPHTEEGVEIEAREFYDNYPEE